MFRPAGRWFAWVIVLLAWVATGSWEPAAAEGPDGGPVSSVSRTGDQILFVGLPDESTQLGVQLLTDAPVRYLFTSSESLFAGANCTAVSQFSAYCAVSVGAFITLDLNDGLADGVDSVAIRGSRTIDAIGVFTGLADDVVVVDADGADTGPVTMVGGAGSFDELWLDDSESAGGRTYTVTSGAITRTNSGSYSHSEAEVVRLFSGGGSDLVLVNGTAATTTTLASTGAGSDTIQLGTTTLDSLDGVVFLDGEANTDFLTLKDTGTGVNQVFSVDSTLIARGGFAGVAPTSVESIWVDGGTGHDQWHVASTPAAMHINSGNGIDSFTIGDNLDGLAGPLSIDGQGNIDQLDIDDRGNTTPAEYTLTSTNLYRQVGPPVTSIAHAGIEGITLNTQDAASEIWIAGTPARTFVYAHDGDDQITVGDGSVNNVRHTVDIFGGDGADDVLIDDVTAPQGGGSYALTSNTFDRINGDFGLLQYAEVESLTLNAQELGNEIGVTSTAAGVDYVLNGGDGPDEMGIGMDLDQHLGDLFVRGNGGTDSFNVYDTVPVTGNTYELRAGRIERIAQPSRPPIDYETVENVRLFTGAGSETVTLLGTVPGTTTTVETGDQTDFVTVAAPGLAASGLAVLKGGPGFDFFGLHDGGLGSSTDGSTVTTPGRHSVSYSEFENAQVFASDADTDDDGCPDVKEIGPDRIFGGERSPFNFYDWFDVAATGGGPRDGAIDLSDTLLVLAHFGEGPGDAGYLSTLDREAFYPALSWRPFPANGANLGIDLQDALISLQSFGHSCL